MECEETNKNSSSTITVKRSDAIHALKQATYCVSNLRTDYDADRLVPFMRCFNFSSVLNNSLFEAVCSFAYELRDFVETIKWRKYQKWRCDSFAKIERISSVLNVVTMYLYKLYDNNFDINIAIFYSRALELHDYCVDKSFIKQMYMANEAKLFISAILSSDCCVPKYNHALEESKDEKLSNKKDNLFSCSNKGKIVVKKERQPENIPIFYISSGSSLEDEVFQDPPCSTLSLKYTSQTAKSGDKFSFYNRCKDSDPLHFTK